MYRIYLVYDRPDGQTSYQLFFECEDKFTCEVWLEHHKYDRLGKNERYEMFFEED